MVYVVTSKTFLGYVSGKLILQICLNQKLKSMYNNIFDLLQSVFLEKLTYKVDIRGGMSKQEL